METSPLPPNRTYEERISEFTSVILGAVDKEPETPQDSQEDQGTPQIPSDS